MSRNYEQHPELFPAGAAAVYDPDADGAKADARARLRALETLNEEIDQAAAVAGDLDVPEVKALLGLAWWHAERALRLETGAGSCGHARRQTKPCECCAHYEELRPQAERIGRMLLLS